MHKLVPCACKAFECRFINLEITITISCLRRTGSFVSVLLRSTKISLLKASDRFSDVVDAYEHALLGLYPRARYVVGWDAWVFIWIQALPEWMADWLSVHLYSNMPLPACVRK